MQLPADGDVAQRAIDAGGADAYLQRVLHDTKSLRSVGALARLVGAQQAALQDAARAGPGAFRAAADHALGDVRALLAEIEAAAAALLAEYDARRAALARHAAAFAEQRAAAAEAAAVAKCRAIADAYHDALRPLSQHAKRGGGAGGGGGAAGDDAAAAAAAGLGAVAGSVRRLVDAVQSVRGAVAGGEFGPPAADHARLLASLENRTVDAVIKARAAFVNILDNAFRAFGWPMRVPRPGADDALIATVNFFVAQLHALQAAAETSDFIPERTRWQRALSDSWAVAPILRAPLARFKYHFLETFRAELGPDAAPAGAGAAERAPPPPPAERKAATSRFDRPEWAADFALERIQEATPFLREIDMDGPQTAEVKFVNGFCRVFADKIAYDCELAMRSSKNDSDADSLISHAAGIAKQFDVKLGSGSLFDSAADSPPEFPSALSLLSENTVFFTAWASSELRLAETQVSVQLEKILALEGAEGAEDPISSVPVHPPGVANGDTPSYDLEADCTELLQLVGEAGSGCRHLSNKPSVASFLRLTELPLLQSVRARLRQTLDGCEWAPSTFADSFQCARAVWCAQVLAELLEDRIFEPFYASFEKEHGFSLYAEEIDRLKAFINRAVLSISSALAENFVAHVQGEYLPLVRLGELASQDAAVVLAHDLSEPLCAGMTELEGGLRGVGKGIGNRKLAASIWRPAADRVDAFFFGDVVMQMFAGGTRNALPAASPTNAFLEPRTAAKMARQVAFDTSAVVAVFGNVTPAPQNFLPSCADSAPILQMAARRVIRPNIAPKQGHDEAVKAVCKLAEEDCSDKEVERAREALQGLFGTRSVTPRECLELFAIAGVQEAIPLS